MRHEPTKPHLALVIPTIDQIGGAERQVLLLATELATRGFRVTLIALSGSGKASEKGLSSANTGYLSLGMKKAWIDPVGWFRYLLWARRNRPDILHAHLPHAIWFARSIRLFYPVRIVIDTIHTSRIPSPFQRFAYRTSKHLSSLTTCVSHAVAKTALDARLVNPEKCIVILNGLSLPPPATSSSLPGTPSAPFHWIAVGRLAPVKDYPTLIQAFSALPNNPKLTILGEGPERQNLIDLTHKLSIGDRIHFAGFHPNVRPFLAQADAFVLSSKWEGLPLGILEAQAESLPVVATQSAGTTEALLPEVTGLLVPIEDPATLTQAMLQLMNMTRNQRIQMGRQGRNFVENNFDIKFTASQWCDLYLELLDQHPKPKRRATATLTPVAMPSLTESSRPPRTASAGREPIAREPATPPLPGPPT